MYRGPFTHRGEPIAGNHRPTPRIAQAVATRLGNEAQNHAWGTSPNLYRAMQSPSLADTQAAINNYRDNRDYNKFGPDADLSAEHETAKTGKFIGDAVQRERTGKNYGADEPYGK
jgi:hypothetical protein